MPGSDPQLLRTEDAGITRTPSHFWYRSDRAHPFIGSAEPPASCGDHCGSLGEVSPAPGLRLAASRLHFNRTPSRSRAGWRRQDCASFVAAAGAEATHPPAAHPAGRRSPAHDLVGQQHTAHLRVLVLALIDDGLHGDTQRRALHGALAWASRCPPPPGPAGGQVHRGPGEAVRPPMPPCRRVTQRKAQPRRPPLPGALQASSGFHLQRISVSWAGAKPGCREPGHIGPGTPGSQPLGYPHGCRAASWGHCLHRIPMCVSGEAADNTL